MRPFPAIDWTYDNDAHYLADLATFGPFRFYDSNGWSDAHIPRTDTPVRFFPRRSFVETSWKSHTWTPRDAEAAKRHAEMRA